MHALLAMTSPGLTAAPIVIAQATSKSLSEGDFACADDPSKTAASNNWKHVVAAAVAASMSDAVSAARSLT
jgi:hypothetical protein